MQVQRKKKRGRERACLTSRRIGSEHMPHREPMADAELKFSAPLRLRLAQLARAARFSMGILPSSWHATPLLGVLLSVQKVALAFHSSARLPRCLMHPTHLGFKLYASISCTTRFSSTCRPFPKSRGRTTTCMLLLSATRWRSCFWGSTPSSSDLMTNASLRSAYTSITYPSKRKPPRGSAPLPLNRFSSWPDPFSITARCRDQPWR